MTRSLIGTNKDLLPDFIMARS